MANVIQYNPSDPTVANKVTVYLTSVNTPDYEEQPNTLINPDLSGVSEIAQAYWKVSGTDVVEMTQAEKDAIDAANAAVAQAVVETALKAQVLPADYAGELSIDCTVSGLDITTVVTALSINDLTSIVADLSETKYARVSLIYNETSDSFYINIYEKTTGVYADLDADEYLVQQDIKEFYVVANGDTLVEVA